MSQPFMHQNLYRFDVAQASYWEAIGGEPAAAAPALAADDSCDVAIIGGGYTGLSAALHLARDHHVDVRVLDAGHIGWGASGRNAGFCCVGGSALTGEQLIKKLGADSARDYYQSTVAAVETVRELIEEEGIDADVHGEAEIEIAHNPGAAERLRRECRSLPKTLGAQLEFLTADECRERLFDCTEAFGAKIHRPAFGLHPLRYCRGMASSAVRHGARLHARSRVLRWQTGGREHRLDTAAASLRAKRVVYACNGFMEEGLHPAFDGRWLPIISAIIVTRPLSVEELARQCWRTDGLLASSRQVLNYFRLLPDRRLLFGGRGTSIGDPEDETLAYEDLRKSLHRLFPAFRDLGIDYRWHGLICFTPNFLPTLGLLDDPPGTWFAYGYHGNGVSEATWCGKQIADWIATGHAPPGVPAAIRGPGRRFPFASVRRDYFRAALAFAKWRDARSIRRSVRS